MVATTFGQSDSHLYNLHKNRKAIDSGYDNGRDFLTSIQTGLRHMGQTKSPNEVSDLVSLEADQGVVIQPTVSDNPQDRVRSGPPGFEIAAVGNNLVRLNPEETYRTTSPVKTKFQSPNGPKSSLLGHKIEAVEGLELNPSPKNSQGWKRHACSGISFLIFTRFSLVAY